MNTKVRKQPQDKPVEASTKYDDFNFELWAKEVRTQLVAALQKRSRRFPDE